MNRSIAKTRNQLQRITLKINQLKTKYTGDVGVSNSSIGQNSPTHAQKYKQKQFVSNSKPYRQSRQPRQPIIPSSTYQSKQIHTSSLTSSANISHKNSIINTLSHNPTTSYPSKITSSASTINQQTYQRQFKIFRHEIYNYIQKCILLNRQKQQQFVQKILEKALQKSRYANRNKDKDKYQYQERIKKIQEQTTTCISNAQDIIVQVKKNQKYFVDKLASLQNKLRKQMQQKLQQIQNNTNHNNKFATNIQQLSKQIQAVQNQYQYLHDNITTNIPRINKQITEIENKMENNQNKVLKKITQANNQIQQHMNKIYNNLQQQLGKSNKFNVRLQQQLEDMKDNIQHIGNKCQQVEKKQNQIRNVMKQIQPDSISNMIKQQIGQIIQRIQVVEEGLEKNCTDMSSLAQSILALQSTSSQLSQNIPQFQQQLCQLSARINTFQTLQTIQAHIKQSFQSRHKQIISSQESITSTIQVNQQKIKNIQHKITICLGNLEQQIIRQKQSIYDQLLQQLQAKINVGKAVEQQKQNQAVNEENNIISEQGLQQMRRQIYQKINQDIQICQQTIAVRLQQNIIQKMQKIISQHQTKLCQKLSQTTQNYLTHQHLSSLQQNLKNIICSQLQKHQSYRPLIRVQTVDSLQQNSQCIKTSPQSQTKQLQQQCVNIMIPTQQQFVQKNNLIRPDMTIVQQKLNQFQNDINQTIKLLYEDIENKVNQMISHTGVMEFRGEIQNIGRNIFDVNNKIQEIYAILGQIQKAKTVGPYNLNNNQPIDLGSFKQQVYSEIGNQIQKLSLILQRTVEEMEIKVQKLDQNFSYTYQRMSNIEYDNANFKDKLTYLLGQRTTPTKPTQLKPQSQTKKSDNLLDLLGQFNTGKNFFEPQQQQ